MWRDGGDGWKTVACPIALRQVQVRRTADMQLHEVLAQRITGMTLDARRQGRASRIDAGGQASSSGCGAAYGERSASLSPCPGADYRSHDEGFAGLARLIHPSYGAHSPSLAFVSVALAVRFICRVLLPVDALPLYLPLGHVSLMLPYIPAST